MVHMTISIDHDHSPIVWQLGGEELGSSAACIYIGDTYQWMDGKGWDEARTD